MVHWEFQVQQILPSSPQGALEEEESTSNLYKKKCFFFLNFVGWQAWRTKSKEKRKKKLFMTWMVWAFSDSLTRSQFCHFLSHLVMWYWMSMYFKFLYLRIIKNDHQVNDRQERLYHLRCQTKIRYNSSPLQAYLVRRDFIWGEGSHQVIMHFSFHRFLEPEKPWKPSLKGWN